MTIDKYIKKIRMSITNDKPYDEYKNLLFEYIEFLENALNENPENIKAVCQLAIIYMEAREPVEKSIELMENTLEDFRKVLKEDEVAQLLNNLAFFYAEEMYDIDKAKQLLEKAVKCNSNFPNPYNALGIIYLNEDNIVDALEMFNKATYLSKNIKYHNNYAVALYQAGHLEKATDIFNEISKEWRNNEVAVKAYYSYGMIKSIIGDAAVGIEVAKNLSSILDFDICVNAYEIADLYFICKEYEKCVELYDSEKLYPSMDWLNIYFYSFYVLNWKTKLEKVFKEIINEMEKEIKEEQIDNDEDWTVEERKEYIKDLNKDIKEFTVSYNAILNKGYEPNINFKPELIFGCYLINCPRHRY